MFSLLMGNLLIFKRNNEPIQEITIHCNKFRIISISFTVLIHQVVHIEISEIIKENSTL
jgi:hypothetical protein